MADKKGSPTHIGLALLVIGILGLLESLNVFTSFKQWWMPIIMVIVGIMVIIDRKGVVNILGWILLIYGILILLMVIGLFSLTFLMQIMPISWILFGLILLL